MAAPEGGPLAPEIYAWENALLKVARAPAPAPSAPRPRAHPARRQAPVEAVALRARETDAALADACATLRGGGGGRRREALALVDELSGAVHAEAAAAAAAFARLAARAAHVAAGLGADAAAAPAWARTRLAALVGGRWLRAGRQQAAAALAAAVPAAAPLLDTDVFADIAEAAAGLARRDTAPALAWCRRRAATLRRYKSTLDFRLHLQALVELVRAGCPAEALLYARTHLAAYADRHLAEMQLALGLLALGPEPGVDVDARYASLLDPERWTELTQLLVRNVCAFHGLPPTDGLVTALQLGLSVLHHPACDAHAASHDGAAPGPPEAPQCPVCWPPCAALAQSLPHAAFEHSRLVCSLSGAVLDANSTPVMLPDGFIYDQTALLAQCTTPEGVIASPRTGQKFSPSDLNRIFLI